MGAMVRSSHADRFLSLLPFDILSERMIEGFNEWGESGHDPREWCTGKQWKVVLRTVRALKRRLPLPSGLNLGGIMHRFSNVSLLGMTYYRVDADTKEQREIVKQGIESVYDYILDRTAEFIDEVQGEDEDLRPTKTLRLRRQDARRMALQLLMGDGIHGDAFKVLKELVLDPLELDEVAALVVHDGDWAHIPPVGCAKEGSMRSAIRVRIEGTFGLDHWAVFTGTRGQTIRVAIRHENRHERLDTRRDLMFVEIIRRFRNISHVRLPGGEHLHVPNSIIAEGWRHER